MQHECQQMRRMLIGKGTLNLNTGETTIDTQEWVTTKCAIPLFSEEERQRGLCRSCFGGWTHPHNFPVEEDE